MEENVQTKSSEKKTAFTVKRVLKVLWLLCIVFVFCPSFLVSCSGTTVNVNVLNTAIGISVYGGQATDPHPIILITLLIPIVMLIFLFKSKSVEHKISVTVLAGAAIDFVVWLLFRSEVKKVTSQNLCTFKTTPWYVINLLVLILIVVLGALVMKQKMQMESDLVAALSGGGTKAAISQMTKAVTQMSSSVAQMAGNAANKKPEEPIIGYCSQCGKPIKQDFIFCTECGTPVPESLLEAAEAARKAAEEAARKAAEEAERRAAEEAARKAAEEAERRAAEEAAKKAAEEAARKAAEETAENAAEETAGEGSEEPVQDNRKATVRFCRKCGAKLKSDAIFCESCGTKVE